MGLRRQSPPPPPPPPPQQPQQQQQKKKPLQRATSIPDTLLNKYRMGRLLGRGSFAKVFAAYSIADGDKPVAIKIIDKTKTDSIMEPKIICEIKAMRRLQHHPNVLRILEVMATKTKIFIVMELAVGGDLFSKVVQRGRMKESGARRYFQQLVSALHFCHENGVAHRDVKPQNLLLDSDGNLKVSDFGLSALAEAAEATGVNGILHTACGTPAFTAPEVLYRRGYDGAKADAWSCGVILFFLLSASLPFDDSNLALMYKKIHRKQYQIPAWVSKPARFIVHQLLDPNPQTRMSIETLMNHPWFLNKYQSPSQRSLFESEYSKSCKFDTTTLSSFNAFDIISMSSGLDLSGLFEATCRTEKRFTSTERLGRVIERVKDVGKKLDYRVEEGKGGAIGLAKGKLVLLFEAMEIAEKMVVAEVRVAKGCGMEFEEVHLVELKNGLGDIVLQWHGDLAVPAM